MHPEGNRIVFDTDEQREFEVQPSLTADEAAELAIDCRELAMKVVATAVTDVPDDNDPRPTSAFPDSLKGLIRATNLELFADNIARLVPVAVLEAEQRRAQNG